MLQLFKTTNYDFMGRRKIGYGVSGLLLLGGLLALVTRLTSLGEPLNYGIDFRGGSLFQVRFVNPPSSGELDSRLEAAGFEGVVVQFFRAPDHDTVLIRMPINLESSNDLVSRVRAAIRPAEEQQSVDKNLIDLNSVSENELATLLQRSATGEEPKSLDPLYADEARKVVTLRSAQGRAIFPSLEVLRAATDLAPDTKRVIEERTYVGSVVFQRTESVGPVVGKELRKHALLASLLANGLILAYLWVRFELRYGVAAVVCIVHDCLVILGAFAFTGREFDLTVLAGILTIIGYSVNDTIVVFDRIRENVKLMRGATLETLINTSVNQTLSRTVITSGLTLLVVVGLYLFGGAVLNNFAFALIIGIVVGTFSSIFVASPLLIVWRRLFAQG